MKCYSCGAETSNGLALCDLCQRGAGINLEFLPVYFRNLARWRPGRAGSRPVPGSRVLYDGPTSSGTGDRISDALDATANMLTTRARELCDDRPHLARLLDRLAAARAEERIDEAQAVAWLCKGFERFLVSVATLDWCGDFVRDLGHHEHVLRSLTEVSVPGWYAGACARRVSMEAACGAPTYVVPGLTWVTCGACGTTTYARDHLDAVIDEAREWVARPKAIAEALVALLDTEQSVPRLYDRIRKWESLGWLEGARRSRRGYVWSFTEERMVVGQEEVGPKRYRLGDVLDLATGHAGTSQADRMTSA